MALLDELEVLLKKYAPEEPPAPPEEPPAPPEEPPAPPEEPPAPPEEPPAPPANAHDLAILQAVIAAAKLGGIAKTPEEIAAEAEKEKNEQLNRVKTWFKNL